MRTRHHNPKPFGIMEAKRQFSIDLHTDKDFIEFKKRSYKDYGTVNIAVRSYVIEITGPTCETLISQYIKSIKKQTNSSLSF